MNHASQSSIERAENGAPVSTRGKYLESVAVTALRDAAGMARVLEWVAALRQGAIVPWSDGIIILLPATPAMRAAVAIGFFRGATPWEMVRGTLDLPCDVLVGASAIDLDDLARVQRVADACPTVYAPRFTAAARQLRRMAEVLAHADVAVPREGNRGGPSPFPLASRNDRAGDDDLPPRLAALRTGDGASEQSVFVARPGDAIARTRRLVARPPSAHATLDAAAFVATAERCLRGAPSNQTR